MSSNSTDFRIEIRRHTQGEPWTYAQADQLQKKIRDEILNDKRQQGVMLFSEFAPVITLGKRRTSEDLLLSRKEYAAHGIEIIEIDRGGRATYHGPGQWTAFVIDTLEHLTGDRKGVRKVSCALLEALQAVAREKFPHAEIREDEEVGVWSSHERSAGKLGAVGIQIQNGILQHGIALNIFSTPQSFFGIHPCGISSARADFLENSPDDRAFESWRVRLESALRENLTP